jgi:opacity protein-like surface antigen
MKRRFSALLAAMALFGVLGAQAVSATHVEPVELTAGNNQCDSDDTKIDPVADGTYNLVGGGTITIDVRSTDDGQVFDWWTTNATVSAIVVKGGPNYHTYFYADETSDTGLHSPFNANSGKWYGLSHLCIDSSKKHSGGGK